MSRPSAIKIRKVFRSLGQPGATYVKRERGRYEKQLSEGIDAGVLCLLTGPSKTGKTTLYSKVLTDKGLDSLIVRCDETLSAQELWKRALEKVDFERLATRQKARGHNLTSQGKVGGKVGWVWLASLLGEVSVGVNSNMEELEIRERILSQPSPNNLIPLLEKFPVILIVEDAHYLRPEVQRHVFQQWKAFVDAQVPVIVVGTTHHSANLAFENRDLVGRIAQIDLNTWNTSDLSAIATQGFEYLKLGVAQNVTTAIAEESAGLPIITQETCFKMLNEKGLDKVIPGKTEVDCKRSDAYYALHEVARINYSQFEAMYDRLVTGPRKKARKYNTYELVLSTFTEDPLTFSLKRHELDQRLRKIPIPEEQRPPRGSVTSTLRALGKFQERNDLELLEWNRYVQRLYIVEPSFLFYLRWKDKRNAPLTTEEFIEQFLDAFHNT